MAGVAWHLFAKAHFNPFTNRIAPQRTLAPVQHIEAEEREATENHDACFMRMETKGVLYNGAAAHVAGDDDTGACSGSATYTFNLVSAVRAAAIQMRYSDAAGGDGYEFSIDGKVAGDGVSSTTASWQTFTTSKPIAVGDLAPGVHTLKVRITDARTRGMTIDAFDVGGQ